MAIITDYATLKTEVENYLARSDLTSDAPRFIQAGEELIYSDLRVRQMETALSSAISSGVVAVPSGYREMKFAYLDGSPVVPLVRVSLEELYNQYPTRSADRKPVMFARNGSNFEFGPYPDDAYTMKGVYYKKLDVLSDSNTDNWLTDEYPSLILYASLFEAALFIKSERDIATFGALYDRHKQRVKSEDKREDFSGSVMSPRAG